MIQGVNEGLGGFKDVTVMNRKKMFFNKFKEYVNNLTEAEIFKGTAKASSKPIIEFASVFGMIFIAFAMIWQDRPISTVVPVLTLFGAATVRLMPAVNRVVNQLTGLRYYIHALSPVHADLTSMEEYYLETKESSNNNEKLKFNNSIIVKDLWYKYPNTEDFVLKDINIKVPKNSAIGFVGSTGAGKSTIVDVILGLLSPDKGKVIVDETDISENKRAWQNNVGYIPQFIYLSDDTIRHNIAFGIPEELISEKKINAAIEAAQLEDFIQDLPEGIDTVVGEEGVRLSGGQKQRIGIARALYDNPDVLIMDEATSSLDNVTERKVISAIEALKGERTIIMIAHRLTTVENCDVLYMMKDGKVIEKGTYDELLESSYDFQKMKLA